MGRSGQAGLVLIPRGFVYIFNVLLAVKSIFFDPIVASYSYCSQTWQVLGSCCDGGLLTNNT